MTNPEELSNLEDSQQETPEQAEVTRQLREIAETLGGNRESSVEKKESKEKLFSQTLNVGDILVSKSGTRREIKEIVPDKDDPQKRVFKFEKRGKDRALPQEETLDSNWLDSQKDKVDYTLTSEQQARVKEKPSSETFNIGDVIVSKSGTRREIKEINPNENDPKKRVFNFERVGKSGSTREETLDSGSLDSQRDNIDYTLTSEQQLRAKGKLKEKRNEYMKKDLSWEESLWKSAIERDIYEKDRERQIYKEDLEKKKVK